MNESTSRELNILVERAVRPVRAGAVRKRKMREELLAHVTETFQEELAGTADDRAALEQTIVRFGDPVELTVKLQDSVPAADRFVRIVDRLWFRPGESWWRCALRQAVWIELLFLAPLAAGWFVSRASRAILAMLPAEALRRLGLEQIASFAAVLAFTSMGQWMWRAQYGPRGRQWREMLLIAVICGVIAVSVHFTMDVAQQGFGHEDVVGDLLAAAFGMLWAPTGMIAMNTARNRYDDEWERTELN